MSAAPWLTAARDPEALHARAALIADLDALATRLALALERSTAARPIPFLSGGATLTVGAVLSRGEVDLLVAVLREARDTLFADGARS